MSNFKLKGLVAAPFTPFHENGELNLTLIKPYIDSLLGDGVKSVFICGTTGEGASMTLAERKLVAEKWVEVGKDKLDAIVVHVGAGNLIETMELAKHSEEIGATAIASVPSIYFKPKAIDQLVDYMKSVGSAAPNLPLYYYHIPGLTGVNLPMDEFVAGAIGKIPTFCGIKFGDPDLITYGIINSRFGGQYQMCFSKDELLLPSLTFGSEAFVGSTYNFCGKPCNRVIEAYRRKDLEAAQKEQFKFLEMVKVLLNHGLTVATQKAMMSLSRLDLGPARVPLPNLTSEQKESLKQDLTNIGYFEWIK